MPYHYQSNSRRGYEGTHCTYSTSALYTELKVTLVEQ